MNSQSDVAGVFADCLLNVEVTTPGAGEVVAPDFVSAIAASIDAEDYDAGILAMAQFSEQWVQEMAHDLAAPEVMGRTRDTGRVCSTCWQSAEAKVRCRLTGQMYLAIELAINVGHGETQ